METGTFGDDEGFHFKRQCRQLVGTQQVQPRRRVGSVWHANVVVQPGPVYLHSHGCCFVYAGKRTAHSPRGLKKAKDGFLAAGTIRQTRTGTTVTTSARATNPHFGDDESFHFKRHCRRLAPRLSDAFCPCNKPTFWGMDFWSLTSHRHRSVYGDGDFWG